MTMVLTRRRRVVAKRYQLETEWREGLAQGYWLAYDTVEEREVVLYEVAVDGGDDLAATRRAESAAAVSHDRLIPVLEVVSHGGRVLAVQELSLGPTLADYVADNSPLATPVAARLAADIAEAIAELEAAGLAHGALSPFAIHVESGRARVGFVGAAHQGNDVFVAPEVRHPSAATTASDLWSLGALLDGLLGPAEAFAPGPEDLRAGLHALAERLAHDEPELRPNWAQVVEILGRAASSEDLALLPTAAQAMTSVFTATPPQAASSSPWVRPPDEEEDEGRSYRVFPSWPPPARVSIPLAIICLLVIVVLVGLLVTNGYLGGRSSDDTETVSAVGEARIPDGWTVFEHDDVGFTLAYPPGWQVRQDGTVTEFRDPRTGAFLRADYRSPPGASPLQTWLDLEGGFVTQFPDYVRLQMTPTRVNGREAAIWEFRYVDGENLLHGVDLGIATETHAYALYFQTPDDQWEDLLDTFYGFAGSFSAP